MLMRRLARLFLAGLAGLAACAATLPSVGGQQVSVPPPLIESVTFDHRCKPEEIKVVRRRPDSFDTWDLEVRGKVRRYKSVWGSWLDVTSLYPESVLTGAP